MEGDILPIIRIDAIESDDGATQISADIFDHSSSITKIGFSINVKTIFVFAIDKGFGFFERRTDTVFQFI